MTIAKRGMDQFGLRIGSLQEDIPEHTPNAVMLLRFAGLTSGLQVAFPTGIAFAKVTRDFFLVGSEDHCDRVLITDRQ